MTGLAEVIADLILGPIYLFLIIRLATSTDPNFKSPFYTFFIATGLYSITTMFSYQVIAQFIKQSWTVHVYKVAYALNTTGAVGSTIGKCLIVIHRYFVIRNRDFAEKRYSRSFIRCILASQFAFSVLMSTPVWLSSLIYTDETKTEVQSLSYTETLILKSISTGFYTIYVICNSTFTVLTSRQLLRLRSMIEVNPTFGDSHSKQKIMTQQRNMFIIVSVCSISHLIKALQQLSIAITTYIGLVNVTTLIWSLYPLVNGLAAYTAPICLILLSRAARKRLLSAIIPSLGKTPVSPTTIEPSE